MLVESPAFICGAPSCTTAGRLSHPKKMQQQTEPLWATALMQWQNKSSQAPRALPEPGSPSWSCSSVTYISPFPTQLNSLVLLALCLHQAHTVSICPLRRSPLAGSSSCSMWYRPWRTTFSRT